MFKKMNSKLEALFEQKPDILANPEYNLNETQKTFQILNNNQLIENLSYVFEGEVTQKNLEPLFLQLSSYFEIGFLMQKINKTDYKMQSAFVYAKKINNTKEYRSIRLPVTPVFHILKTPASSFLKKFNMQTLDPSNKMDAYLLAISPTQSIVLITLMAEPWAGLKIQTLQNTLMKINFNL